MSDKSYVGHYLKRDEYMRVYTQLLCNNPSGKMLIKVKFLTLKEVVKAYMFSQTLQVLSKTAHLKED